MTESLAGKLLVATPKLTDANFDRTVVYLCMHDENGALGLVLNRPADEVSVIDHVPAWAEVAATPASIFVGGPVEPAVGLGLARLGPGPRPPEPGWTQVDGQVGLIDLNLDPRTMETPVEAVRVFVGYAGWGAEQLDGEVAEEAWFVVEAEPGDLFSDDPDGLWRRVVRRQAGKVAMFAYAPEDPTVN